MAGLVALRLENIALKILHELIGHAARNRISARR